MCKDDGSKKSGQCNVGTFAEVLKNLHKEEVPASGKKKKSIVGHRRKDAKDRDRRVTIR